MNEKLTLQELIDLLAARHQMEPQDADSFVKAFWALVEEGLKRDNYVKIKGLGTFKLIETEARESIDVNSGERIEIQSHTRVTFSPDASLRDQINRPFSHFETVILNEGTQFENWDEKIEADEEELENLPENDLEEGEEEGKEKTTVSHKTALEIESIEPIVKTEPEKPLPPSFIAPEEELPAEPDSLPIHEERKTESFVTDEIIEEELPLEEEPQEEITTETNVRMEAVQTAELTTVKEVVTEEQASEADENSDEEVTPEAMEDPAAEELHEKQDVVEEMQSVSETSVLQETTVPPTQEESESIDNKNIAPHSTSVWDEEFPAKKAHMPWCMIASVLLIGIILGGLVSWAVMSGRRYIPESMVKSFLKAEKELKEQKDLLADSLSIVTELLADTAVQQEAATDSLTELPLKTAEVAREETPSAKKNGNETVNKQPEPVKVLSDKIPYKITGTIGTHTIRRGDSLVKIALKFYGNKKLWTYIVKHNRKTILNPDNVPIGTVIQIPQLAPADN